MDEENDDLGDMEDISFRRNRAQLQRGFSKSGNNIGLVNTARQFLLQEKVSSKDQSLLAEVAHYTFVLPNLLISPEDFKAFLLKDLVDSSVLVCLEQEGHLNWWTDMGVCQRLYPIVTSGDGNCLLHAASLAMWGFHDRVLALRAALHQVIQGGGEFMESLKRRWLHQQQAQLKSHGFDLESEEWEKEWTSLLHLSSLTPKTGPSGAETHCLQNEASSSTYESLDELHVFALSHVIRRPIIVVASPFLKDHHGDDLSPVPFRGVYLPLDHPPSLCCPHPLLLVYNSGHFSALCPMQDDGAGDGGDGGGVDGGDERQEKNMKRSDGLTEMLVPLTDKLLHLLPIHFLHDPLTGERGGMNVLKEYLSLERVSARGGLKRRRRKSSVQSTRLLSLQDDDHSYLDPNSSTYLDHSTDSDNRNILCARLLVQRAPFVGTLVENYMASVRQRFELLSQQRSKVNKQITSSKSFLSDLVGGRKRGDAGKGRKNEEVGKGRKNGEVVKDVKHLTPSSDRKVFTKDNLFERNNKTSYDPIKSLSLNRLSKVNYVGYDQLACPYNNNQNHGHNNDDKRLSKLPVSLQDYRLVQPVLPSEQRTVFNSTSSQHTDDHSPTLIMPPAHHPLNHHHHQANTRQQKQQPHRGIEGAVSETFHKFFNSNRSKQGNKSPSSFVHIGNSRFYADIKEADARDSSVSAGSTPLYANHHDTNPFQNYDFSTFPQRSSTAHQSRKPSLRENISDRKGETANGWGGPLTHKSHEQRHKASQLPQRPPQPQQKTQQQSQQNQQQLSQKPQQKHTLKQQAHNNHHQHQQQSAYRECLNVDCALQTSGEDYCHLCQRDQEGRGKGRDEGRGGESDDDVFKENSSHAHKFNQTTSHNPGQIFPPTYTSRLKKTKL